MVQVFALAFLISIALPAVAMDQNYEPLELSITDRPLYIGNCPEREDLEIAYGKKFSINTVFFGIRLLNVLHHKHLHCQVPRKVAYEDILASEGDVIKLNLHGQQHDVICRQMSEGNIHSGTHFEDVVATFMAHFSERAAWSHEGDSEKTLRMEKVINDESKTLHGENKSPYLEPR